MVNYLKKNKFHPSTLWTMALFLLLPLGTIAAESSIEATQGKSWTSAAGEFRVSYSSELEPITINQIHHWILHLETIDGVPVPGAEIIVTGGMPAHNHGLPTSPRSTQYLGNGDYLIEGMRFHMAGYWEITVTITTGGVSDMVLIPLEL